MSDAKAQFRAALTEASAAVSIAREVIEARDTLSPAQTRSALLGLMNLTATLTEHAEYLQARADKLEVLLGRAVNLVTEMHSRLPAADR